MIKENWNRMDWLQKLPDFSLPEVSDICKSHILNTVQHIAKKSLWALKMLDSSSKIPTSVLEGNVFNFGNYDECLDVDVKEKWGSFIGQHCMANIQIPLATGIISGMNATTFPLYWSACIPSTCSAKEFENMLKVVVPLNISVPEYLCHHRNQQRPYQAEDWIAIAILVILALLSIAGTIHTLLVKDPDRQFKGLAIFSWYQNGKSLLSTKTSPDSLAALHGIRVISIFLVVYGHSYEYTGISPQMNFLRAEEDARRWKNLMIYSGLFAVDTFFLISGLLLCYIFMKTLDKGFRFNAPTFYFHRFLRVTPALAILVLLQTSLIPRLSNGPIWDVVMTNILQKECVKHWWSTLLFVQNYTNPKELCIGVSWFLCVDMQMYWISPVFLLALHKKPKLGIGLLIATMIGGIIIAFQQAYVYGDNNSIISERGVAVDRYYQTHTRFVPWIVGLACGYLLHRTTEWRNRVAVGTEHLSKKIVISGWTISIICCAGTLAAIHPFQQKDYVYNAIEASLFASLSHAIWALSVAWIIFACVSGYGGFVNTILSWPALLPLSRLTFSLYLIHLVFISVFLAMYKAPGYMQEMEMLLIFLGYLVGSLLLSVVMTLLVESPIIGLEKILFKRAKTSAEYRRSFEDEELQKIKRSTENTKYL